VQLTREAIERGARLIYQGALSEDPWLGYPDFILQTGTPQARRFEPEDAKLSQNEGVNVRSRNTTCLFFADLA
jgi:hypothetical protein